jgi:hypothetical protein
LLRDNKDGTVSQASTDLSWQQRVSPFKYLWDEAKSYCSQLALNGTGWRLPTLLELRSIVEPGKNPSIDAAFFPATPSDWFWAVEQAHAQPELGHMGVNFAAGTSGDIGTGANSVRCVR